MGGYGVDNWSTIEAAQEGGELVETITVTIAFNSQGDAIDNLYQNKECSYNVYVEAVQGNAETVDPIQKDMEETNRNSDTYYIYSEEGMRLMTAIADATPLGGEFFLNFELMADLDMTGVPYYPTTRFWVNFNGNGHTISNLTAVHNPNDTVKKAGLFAYGNNVKNVTLKNVNVTGNQAGLVIGGADGNTVSNVTIAGNNSVTWVDSGLGWKDGGIGAIAGVAWNSKALDVKLADNATITLNYNGLENQLDYFADELGGCFVQALTMENVTLGTNAKINKVGEFWYLATDATSLRNGTSKGYNVKMMNDIALNADLNAPYGNNYAVAQNGGVLDGNGKTLTMYNTVNGGSIDDYGIMTSGGTIKNLTIDSGFRAVMIMYAQSDVELDNVDICAVDENNKELCYVINTGEVGADKVKLIVKNSTLGGWTSFGDAISSAEFTNCNFVQGAYYTNDSGRLVKPYVNTTFEGCRFVNDMYLDCSAFDADKIDFKNCSMLDGTAITAQNLMMLFNSGVYGNGAYNDWKFGGSASAEYVPIYVDGVAVVRLAVVTDGLYQMVDGSYLVTNANGLGYFSAKALTGNNGVADVATISLLNDIDMQGAEFSAIIAQRGDTLNFNGNGYAISNVNVVSGDNDNTTGQAGLFYCYPNSTLNVSNLVISNVTVTAELNGTAYAAAIVGYAEGNVVLNNVDVINATVKGGKSSGSLVGHLSGSLTATDCSVTGSSVTLVEFAEEANGHYAGKVLGTLAGPAKLTGCEFDVTVSGCLKADNIGDVYGRKTAAGSLSVDGVDVY